MPLRDDQKLQVQQATDVVRLIGEHIALRPRGKEFLGLCPFHDDKNPSLHVNPAKQIYKCFSCGAGGDVFSFAQNYHKMTFPEALRHLAERAGIKLEEYRRPDGAASTGPSDRERVLAANQLAVSYFRALYRHPEVGQGAREYVDQRHINAAMVEAFQIGYAADAWDGLVAMIQKKNWDRSAFELAGLVSARQNADGHYDRLRHRLIFPICDALGRTIAFGGRKLRAEDEPKYLNSPETMLFNKSATLFGLHLAKKAIIDSRTAVIVEGYTDVIACHQAGVRNVVATLGTALTPQHVSELRRYCQKVVLVYDGDEAGVKASDRAIEVFLTGELDVALAILPDEYDPAEVFEQPNGTEIWQAAMDGATLALDFQFSKVRQQFNAAGGVTDRQRLIETYLQRLSQAGLSHMTPLRRAVVIQRLSDMLHMNEGTIQELLKRLPPSRTPATPGFAPGTGPGMAGKATTAGSNPSGVGEQGNRAVLAGSNSPSGPTGPNRTPADKGDHNRAQDIASPRFGNRIKALTQAERHLIGCLLSRPALFHLALSDGRMFDEAVTPGEFVSEDGKRLYERLYQLLGDGAEVTLQSLLADLASAGEQDQANLLTLAESEVDESTQGNPEQIVAMLRAAADAIRGHHRDQKYQETRQRILTGEADQEPDLQQQARQVDRLLEQHKTSASPRRIARIGP
ncbi:MAG: DNA primase [Planctomycetota bacterium]|nr:DNA primase [Planctomycetota bacterium]